MFERAASRVDGRRGVIRGGRGDAADDLRLMRRVPRDDLALVSIDRPLMTSGYSFPKCSATSFTARSIAFCASARLKSVGGSLVNV